ncbi:MAG: flagellar hook-basal body complex protein [Saccharospirillum sp.]|nr:flagellar hook-basal body complex protein [Saccharospirillum sp.]
MSFGTGLSGVSAANKDLQVTGNNIANASTTGFKASRTEFGDAYTNSFLGTGQKKAGAGVNVENIGQKFEQGNISQTNSALDLAIDGNGFFVTKYPNNTVTYTRSGIFGIDRNGYITSNQGANLQGFGVNQNGIVSGILQDLRVDTGNQPPRGTHNVDSRVNVPAGAQVLQQDGLITTTNGLAIGVAQTGTLIDTNSTLSTLGSPTLTGVRADFRGTPLDATNPGPDFPMNINTSWTFDVTLTGPNINEGTSALSGTLAPFAAGNTYDDTTELARDLNRAILSNPDLSGKVEFVVMPDNSLQLQTRGVYASDGTAIAGVSNNVGTPLGTLNLDPPASSTLPIAGAPLFVGGASIDMTSDPGQAAAVQGNRQMALTYNDFQPGTNTTLTSSNSLNTFTDGGTGFVANSNAGDNFAFQIQIGNNSRNITMTIPAPDGYGSQAAFAAALQGELDTEFGAGVANVGINTLGRLVITNVSEVGPSSIRIFHDAANTTAANFNMQTLGMAETSSPAPIRVLGEAAVEFNNELGIEVDGDGNFINITIPAGTYSSYNALVQEINNRISTTPGLSGEVVASHINGRLVLERTVVGGTTDLDVDGTAESLQALGLDSATKTLAVDPIDRSHSFRVNLTVPAPDEENRSGSVEISLDEVIQSIEQLAAAINRELASVPEDEYVGVQAEVITNDDGSKQLQFVAIEAGEESIVSVNNLRASGDDLSIEQLFALLQVDPANASLFEPGEPAITNGYPEQRVVLYNEEGDERTNVVIPEGSSAAAIAAQLGGLGGVDARAETEVRLLANNYTNGGDMDIIINGQRITANSFRDMVDEINRYQQTTLNSITAELDDEGDIVLTSSTGIDITVSIDSPNENDSITVQGLTSTAPAVLGGSADAQTNARIGGFVDIVLNEGYRLIEPDPRATGLFNGLTDRSYEPFVINAFDPDDPDTYNETASLPIYDSLGNQHQLQMFYVKDMDDPNRPRALNSWTVYVQIDGEDVGDPDTSLPFPDNTLPTMASHRLFFNADGTIDKEATGDFLVSNWNPIDPETGRPNGAYTGLPVALGGRLPVPDPNTNSNFAVDFGDTTQYGGPFARYNFQQDGYASGRLNDLEIDDDGIIYARYTNGEAQVLGQVALASFASVEGLDPVGQTEWVESFSSGSATIGAPGTGLLGTIRSAALEESTVDLSEQLVRLIIAQRNYQASAKTLETANAVTQTIINLR